MVLTGHADTTEGAPLVQTRALVMARVTLALVDVDLAARPCKPFGAVTPVRVEGKVRFSSSDHLQGGADTL